MCNCRGRKRTNEKDKVRGTKKERGDERERREEIEKEWWKEADKVQEP